MKVDFEEVNEDVGGVLRFHLLLRARWSVKKGGILAKGGICTDLFGRACWVASIR